MRVVVTGGRGYADKKRLHAVLDKITITVLAQGGASGADALAAAYTLQRGLPCTTFKADWKQHGKAAGPIRNREMLTTFAPDIVVAFPGGAGTQNCITIAKSLGIPVLEVTPTEVGAIETVNSRPILFLDVDGVLNPDTNKPDPTWVFQPPLISDEASGQFTLHLSQAMADAIVGLDFNIRWLTTWQEQANANIGAKFGWPTLPYHTLPVSKHPRWGYNLGKMLVVKEELKHKGPLVFWVDDMIMYDFEPLMNEDPDFDPHYRLRTVSPNPFVGITPEDIAYMREQDRLDKE